MAEFIFLYLAINDIQPISPALMSHPSNILQFREVPKRRFWSRRAISATTFTL